jgi:hypothetical protein
MSARNTGTGERHAFRWHEWFVYRNGTRLGQPGHSDDDL